MKRGMLVKAKKSFLGRVLRRLMGEERGAVMMEYIVIALLIAAVAVVAISAFGGYASELFGVIGHAMGGNSSAAKTALNNADDNFYNDSDTANKHVNDLRDEKMTESDVTVATRGGE